MKTPVQQAVIEALKDVGERTRAQVIEHFASLKAKKQAEALIKAIDKIDEAKKALEKIRPTPTAFDADGNPIGPPSFTKDQIDEKKKIEATLKKLLDAVNKADDTGDYGDLYNAVK